MSTPNTTSNGDDTNAPPPTSFASPATTVILPPSSFKLPTPPLFEGQRDGFICEAWLQTLRRFLIGAAIPVEQCTLHAILFLTGNASLWWDGLCLPDSTHIDVFVARFRHAFRPFNFLEIVRDRLLSLTMTSTMDAYVSQFRQLVSFLHSETDGSIDAGTQGLAHTVFLNGLPPVVHHHLQTTLDVEVSAIDVLISKAEYFGMSHLAAQSPASSAFSAPTVGPSLWHNNPTAASPGPQSDYTSMAMEIDNLRLEINALKSRATISKPKSSLTDSERSFLIANGGCFRCRKIGHTRFQTELCPAAKKSQPAQRINNFAESVPTSFSGNAPSN